VQIKSLHIIVIIVIISSASLQSSRTAFRLLASTEMLYHKSRFFVQWYYKLCIRSKIVTTLSATFRTYVGNELWIHPMR